MKTKFHESPFCIEASGSEQIGCHFADILTAFRYQEICVFWLMINAVMTILLMHLLPAQYEDMFTYTSANVIDQNAQLKECVAWLVNKDYSRPLI